MVKFDITFPASNRQIWHNFATRAFNSTLGLRSIKRYLREHHDAKFEHTSGTIEFDSDEALTLFLLKWS